MKRLTMNGGRTDAFEKANACGFNLAVVQRQEDVKAHDVQMLDQLITSVLSDESVVEIAAMANVRNLSGKIRFDCSLNVGEISKNSEYSAERPGYVSGTGTNCINAFEYVTYAMDKVNFNVECANV